MNKTNELYKNRFPLEARKLLDKIEKSINDIQIGTLKTIPNLLIIGDNFEMNDEFSKHYEKILLKNDIYPIHGNKTYLSLVFPKNGSEKDYNSFFISPKIASCTQNTFYGVFSISFEEWEGNELLRCDEFSKLLSFIDENKETIKFVFNVTSIFKEKKALMDLLSNYLLMETIILETINPENATMYVKSVLKDNGLAFRTEASEELKNIILTKMNVNSSDFKGYSSLDIIANNLIYELKPKIGHQSVKVTGDMMKKAGERIFIPEPTNTKYKIGF